MAIENWGEVTQSKAYQELPQDKQEQVRNAFFERVIAPRVPTDSLSDVRQEFDARTLGQLNGEPQESISDQYLRYGKAGASSLAQGTLGLFEMAARAPKLISPFVDAGANYLRRDLDALGVPEMASQGLKKIGVPQSALDSIAKFDRSVNLNPFHYLAEGVNVPQGTEIGGVNIGGLRQPGFNAVGDQIKGWQDDLTEHVDSFKRLAMKGKDAEIATDEAMKGNFAPLKKVMTDPEAIIGFVAQAVPSIAVAYATGGSLAAMSALEGLQYASDAAEYEKKTGQKISPEAFSEGALRTSIIGGLGEKFGFDSMFGPSTGGFLKKIAKAIGEESGTEGFQQLNQNLAEQQTFDPNKKLSEGVLASVIGGAGSGGAFGSAHAIGDWRAERPREIAPGLWVNPKDPKTPPMSDMYPVMEGESVSAWSIYPPPGGQRGYQSSTDPNMPFAGPQGAPETQPIEPVPLLEDNRSNFISGPHGIYESGFDQPQDFGWRPANQLMNKLDAWNKDSEAWTASREGLSVQPDKVNFVLAELETRFPQAEFRTVNNRDGVTIFYRGKGQIPGSETKSEPSTSPTEPTPTPAEPDGGGRPEWVNEHGEIIFDKAPQEIQDSISGHEQPSPTHAEANYFQGLTGDERSLHDIYGYALGAGISRQQIQDVDRQYEDDPLGAANHMLQLINEVEHDRRKKSKAAPQAEPSITERVGEPRQGSQTNLPRPGAVARESGPVEAPAQPAKTREVTQGVTAAPTVEEISTKAHEAATSHQNETPQPTEAQIEAGNYKKGHVKLHGLDITVENPKGSTRSGTDASGKAWESTLQHHYGYIRRTTGADGDHVDTFIGDFPQSQKAYIVDQRNPTTGKFDEHKVMLGFLSKAAAAAGYRANYDKNWKGMQNITEVPIHELKRWLSEGNTQKAYSKAKSVRKPAAIATKPETIATKPEKATEKKSVEKEAQNKTTKDYAIRQTERLDAIKSADAAEQVDAIQRQEESDPERHFVGTAQIEAAARKRRKALADQKESEVEQKKDQESYDAGDWLPVKNTHSVSREEAAKKLKAASSEDSLHEYRIQDEWNQDAEGFRFWLERRKKPASAATKETKPEKVSDAGDNLFWNRKNPWRGGGLKWDEIKDENQTLRVKMVQKSRIWAKPNWDSVLEGVPEKDREIVTFVARMVKGVYDAIPVEPKQSDDESLQRYIRAVTTIKEAAEKLLTDRDAAVAMMRAITDQIKGSRVANKGKGEWISLTDMLKDAQNQNGARETLQPLFAALFPSAMKSGFQKASEENRTANVIGKKAVKALQWGTDDFVRAMEEIKKGWPAKQEAWQRQGLSIISGDGVSARYYEGKDHNGDQYVAATIEVGSRSAIQETFDTKEDAVKWAESQIQYMKGKWLLFGKNRRFISKFDTEEHAQEGAREQVKPRAGVEREAPQPASMDELQRSGESPRKLGEDVTPDQMMAEFGLRGVNFGNYVKNAERQNHLNRAYDALHDLAALLNVPRKALGLNGMLGIAFGAQGHGGRSAAHFIPGVNEINITKDGGAGALAHEWAHALDHYFGVKAGWAAQKEPFASGLLRRITAEDKVDIRPEVAEAFRKIVQAMKTRKESAEEVQKRKEGHLKWAKDNLNRFITHYEMESKVAGNEKAVAALDDLRKGELGELLELPSRKRTKPVIGQNVKTVADAIGFTDLEAERLHSAATTVQFSQDALQSANDMLEVKTKYWRNSAALETSKTKPYWSNNQELFARAFESWVFDKLAEQQARNDYLVGRYVEGSETSAYPVGAERTTINEAFDALIGELKTVERGDRVVLFSKGTDGAGNVEAKAERADWGNFPDVVRNGDLGTLKNNSEYDEAKRGDEIAALALVEKVLNPQTVDALRHIIGDRNPIVQPVLALEEAGHNKIPAMFATVLADRLGLSFGTDIYQIQKVSRTGSKADHRLAHSPVFSGEVISGRDYIIVDDTLTMGGTLASLRGYIQNRGGNVIVAAVLTAHPGAVSLPVTEKLLNKLRNKHGESLEKYWKTEFGYGLDQLTQGEAGHLRAAENVDAIRTRIAEARHEALDGLGERRATETQNRKVKATNPPPQADGDSENLITSTIPKLPKVATTAARAREIIAPIVSQWGANAPRVVVVESIGEIPLNLSKAANRGTGFIKGVYDQKTGTIYLVASALRNKNDVLQTLAHEAVGHYGLAGMLGNEYQSILKQVQNLTKINLKIRKIGEQVRETYGDLDANTHAAEILAKMAEGGVKHPVIARVVGAIRGWLRKMGFNIPFSESDVKSLLARAESWLRKDTGGAAPKGADVLFRVATPEQAKAAVKKIEGWWKALPTKISYKIDETRGGQFGWLGTLTRRALADYGGHTLPELKAYVTIAQKMDAERNRLLSESADMADEWRKYQSADKEEAERLADLMHDSTIAGVDPSQPYTEVTTEDYMKLMTAVFTEQARGRSGEGTGKFMNKIKAEKMKLGFEKKRKKSFPELKARYDALSKDGKELYNKVRDAYTERSDQTYEALKQRIEVQVENKKHRAKLAYELRLAFEASRVQAPYFPLSRFGDYWARSMVDENTVDEMQMFETKAEQKAWIDAKRAEGFQVSSGLKDDIPSMFRHVDSSLITKIETALKDAGASKELQDQIYQFYLQTMPDLSMRKHFIHRKKTAGYSRDALRAFANNMFHGGYQLARLKYSVPLENVLQMANQAVLAKEQNGADDSDKARQLYTELQRRHEWAMNPKGAAWANKLGSLGFVYYLGVSPAAALTNVTQTPLIAFPMMAQKYGWRKASKELARATKEFFKAGGLSVENQLTPEELKVYRQWEMDGLLDKTQSHDLAGIAESGSEYNDTHHKIMTGISALFHHAEKFNREITAVASFRMAREGGKSVEAASKYAEEVTWDAHFDYSSGNKARFMQNDAAKLALMFRQYSFNMIYLLGRNFYQSFKGESPEVKKEAFQKLAGILVMHTIFAGALGLPAVGLPVIFAILNGIFDKKDEPWDAETAMREFLADLLGPTVGEVISKGVVNGALGIDLHSRISLGQLLFRDPPEDLEGRGIAQYWMLQVFGPLGSLVSDALEGAARISEGNFERGVEMMVPKAVKDVMKAVRFMTEGAQTMKGDPIIETFTPPEIAAQFLGFAPARLSEQYEQNERIKHVEKRLEDRKKELLNQYANAIKAENDNKVSDVLDEIANFNESNPAIALTPRQITQSMKARLKSSQMAVHGMHINKKLRYLADEIDYAGNDEPVEEEDLQEAE